MPFKSKAKTRFMFVKKPKLAKEFNDQYFNPNQISGLIRLFDASDNSTVLLSNVFENNKLVSENNVYEIIDKSK